MKPVYNREDILVAGINVTQEPYCADATGNADSTAVLQRALDDLAARGGGTVYLPAGLYHVTKTVHVPAGCVVQGDWADPLTDTMPTYGTVILADPAPSLRNKWIAVNVSHSFSSRVTAV